MDIRTFITINVIFLFILSLKTEWRLWFYPFIHLSSILSIVGELEPISWHWVRGGAHPGLVACQCITGPAYRDTQPFIFTFTHTVQLKSPINLTPICMSLDCGRKLEHPGQSHAYTGRTCKIPTERSWTNWDANWEAAEPTSTAMSPGSGINSSLLAGHYTG